MPASANFLLGSFSPSDMTALMPCLSPFKFEHKRVVYDTDDRVTAVYFPTSAIISIVVSLSTGETVEAAMLGKDGVVGASAALNGGISLSRAIVQMPGDGFVCEAKALKAASMRSETLLAKLLGHEQTVYVQAQQSIACMAAHHVEARLCRWLLRARDLADSDTLYFTQEFLAEMLGVRRTSVTEVAHALQAAGMIKYSRGAVQILNLEALQEMTCECYDTVKLAYKKVMTPDRLATSSCLQHLPGI
jgi:CRP-like cAMP-binding protein